MGGKILYDTVLVCLFFIIVKHSLYPHHGVGIPTAQKLGASVPHPHGDPHATATPIVATTA